MPHFKPVKLTSSEEKMMEVARVSLMAACPFLCHYFYSEMKEFPTGDIKMAATDGRYVYYNPKYMTGLRPMERTFVLAHEIYHVISLHPQRMKSYAQAGALRDKPYSQMFFNACADYIINADLVDNGIGQCNPSWLYDCRITSAELAEDVYQKYWQDSQVKFKTLGASGRGPKGAAPDRNADGNNGVFDELLEPCIDPVTGKEDIPDEMEFKEAVVRAAAAAKAMGNLPAKFKMVVDEILNPQVDWRDNLRLTVTGRIGHRFETWERPNRRRLALNPMLVLPGKRGYGAGLVVCAVDCSGSVSDKELAALFGEICAIMADVRPKEVMLIWCDAEIQRVDTARSLDELAHIRVKGRPGIGGTSFEPPFDYVAREGLRPDTFVYLTDMGGRFPAEPRGYPTIWCATTDIRAPWGDTVRVRV